jgi:hypothetical protein
MTYIYYMESNEDYRTTRIWKKTLGTLRLVAAMQGSSIVAVMDRLANQELDRLRREEKEEMDHYTLSVMRVERTFTAHEGHDRKAALDALSLWKQQENVNKVILRENGEILEVWVPGE